MSSKQPSAVATPGGNGAGAKKLSYSFSQKARLYKYSKQNPQFKARELSAWFKREFGLEIPRSTIYDIIKNPKFDLDLGTMTLVEQAKRKDRKSQHPVLEDALLRYYMLSSETPETFRRDLLLEKAALLWQQIDPLRQKPFPKLGIKWQDKFFVRTALRSRKLQAMTSTPCLTPATPAELQRMLAPFAPRDCFNADETGLFWKLTPAESHELSAAPHHPPPPPRDRISLVLTCNADASEPLAIWAVGCSRTPHSFVRRPAVTTLGIIWRHNPTALVTLREFMAYLRWFDEKMARHQQQPRRVALILTTTTLHRAAVALLDKKRQALVNTTIVWVVPVPTSARIPSHSSRDIAHQPLDYGITHALKTQWRRLWLQYILAQYNSSTSLSLSSVLDYYHLHKALTWLHVAWTEHLSDAVVRTGFAHAAGEHDQPGTVPLEPLVDPVIAEAIATLVSLGLLQSPMPANDFIAPADETLRCEPTLLMRPDWEIAIVAEEINREQAEQHSYNNAITNNNDDGNDNINCDNSAVAAAVPQENVNDDSESVLATSIEVEIRKTLSALAVVDQFLYAYPTLNLRERYQDSVKSMVTSLEGKLAELRSIHDN
ncbi:hypothetical protein D0Z00_001821 [Geotrichum galactomycetum]|uniref:Uncharacterized protein n=1 Tax=Geotrichum galactomycetum TaxID=27317 RepID=A0ACB6V5W1_9ASCO|nr:hypothetical protein D0Z00_001821 [Geotrichum candidum]